MGSDQKISVCHLISGDLWAGAEIQAYTLLRALSHYPDITLKAVILNEGTLSAKLRESGIEVLVVDESQHGFFGILAHIKDCLRGRNIDIIHSHRRKENVLAAMVRRDGLVKHAVQTVHGAPEPFTGWKWLKEKAYGVANMRSARKYFDRILPVSDDIRNALSEKLDSSKLTTVHNAIDPTEVQPSRSADEIRRSLGIEPQQLLVGSAGRMVPVKGFDVFLKAARSILDKKPDIRFLLAGDGPLLENMKTLARQLNLSKQIDFLGFRRDLLDIMSVLDVFVISSHHEGIPTVLLEAMALQKAVVATSVGGVKEVLDTDKCGLLVPPDNPSALAEACLKVLDNARLRSDLGSAARERVTAHFSAAGQSRQVMAVYRQLAGEATA